MAFHEIRFPPALSFGSTGGPERKTEIVTLANGYEERNSPWAHARRHYDAGVGLRNLDDLEVLIAFFEARHGQLHGFRWKDWSDYKSSLPSRPVAAMDQGLGFGDGETRIFGLSKTYRSGDQTYVRPVKKPVASSLQLALAGEILIEGQDYSLDPTLGQITLTAAAPEGAELSAGFEFDVPVRFDTERIDISLASFQAGEVPSVPVVEIRI
jgi:uncharacterized protein (TIGR02217 family)